MHHYGIRGLALKLIESYLTKRSQLVSTTTNEKSSVREITRGVPQGSVLGPLLFILFINDFGQNSISAHCIQFSDDSMLLVVAERSNFYQSSGRRL